MARKVFCVKLEKELEGLAFAPWPGELGKRIMDNVSQEAWQEWLKQQTMLINEKQLSLIKPDDKTYLATQIEAHFFGDGADQPEGYTPPET